jgi:hypothetical protein
VEPIATPKNAALPASRPQSSDVSLSSVNGPATGQLEKRWVLPPQGGLPATELDQLETAPLLRKLCGVLNQGGEARLDPGTARGIETSLLKGRSEFGARDAVRSFRARHQVGQVSIAA